MEDAGAPSARPLAYARGSDLSRGRQGAGAIAVCAVLLLAAAQCFAQGDAGRKLEAAIHRELVSGDLNGAIDAYRSIAADSSAPRSVAARALLQLAQCEERLGQRRDAHATYTRVLREFASENEIAAQARTRLAGWTDALPGPRNLRFDEGEAGKVPPGWFVPALEKTTGSLAELHRKGCRGPGGCAVVVAPATAPGMVGNLMQSLAAAAYRGKTVRLRAWLKVEAASPEDRAQMWLHVFRPGGKPGFFDNMDDRPVRPADWTPCEIVAEIDNDAQFLDFGVTAVGRGRVWLEDVSFDIVPAEQIAAARVAIRRQYGDRTLITGFRFTGPEAVAIVQTITYRDGFRYVETFQDSWERTSDGWARTQRTPLASYFEAPEPDPDAVRTLAAQVVQYAAPLNAVGPRVASDCFALHRADMPAGFVETVLSAAKMRAFFLDLSKPPADSALGRWLAESHLFGGQPVVLAKVCNGIVFVESSGGVN